MSLEKERAPALPADLDESETLFARMLLIRLFEDRILELFDEGSLTGTTHTCVGQEAVAVAAAEALGPGDIAFASHRNHGHYLARHDDPEGLLAELTGREGGVCGGRGGSQNICRDGFFSAGVQGGYMPIAAGMALAEKRRGTGGIVTAFIGDGTLGEGALYEALNMSALWKAPLLVVVEDNRYAQTTPVEINLAGSMAARFQAFGIPVREIESNEVARLLPVFREEAGSVRSGGGPRAVIVHTYRLRAHSKGDDDRPREEIDRWAKRDPLTLAAAGLDGDRRRAIEEAVRRRLEQVERRVWSMAPAPGGDPGAPGVRRGTPR